MKYPKFLKDNDTIGLISTSCSSPKNPYRARLLSGLEYFSNLPYKIKRGKRLFKQENCVGLPHKERAKEFLNFYRNSNIDIIWSVAGGELMYGMMPYIDFEKIKTLPPKLFIGFSDNTNLTFTLTTICDVATIYASGIAMFSYKDFINDDAYDALSLIKGEKLSFDSYENYFAYDGIKRKPLENITYNTPVCYKSLNDEESLEFEGRIIGGCIDILQLLCGTKLDNVESFTNKYKDDGIIFYFDCCDLNSCGLFRALLQLKESHWFNNVKGFIIGRCANPTELMGYTFKQAIYDVLNDYNVPVIYDADISHISPSMPVLNGAFCKVTYKDHKGNLTYILK